MPKHFALHCRVCVWEAALGRTCHHMRGFLGRSDPSEMSLCHHTPPLRRHPPPRTATAPGATSSRAPRAPRAWALTRPRARRCRAARRSLATVRLGAARDPPACALHDQADAPALAAAGTACCLSRPGGAHARRAQTLDCPQPAPAGYNSTSQTTFPCPAGTYKFVLGNYDCTGCGANVATNDTAKTSYADCCERRRLARRRSHVAARRPPASAAFAAVCLAHASRRTHNRARERPRTLTNNHALAVPQSSRWAGAARWCHTTPS